LNDGFHLPLFKIPPVFLTDYPQESNALSLAIEVHLGFENVIISENHAEDCYTEISVAVFHGRLSMASGLRKIGVPIVSPSLEWPED
jgi:hypothetical protein